MTIDGIDSITGLESELGKDCPEVLRHFPMETFLKLINSYRLCSNYSHLPNDLSSFLRKIESLENKHIPALYYKLGLTALIRIARKDLEHAGAIPDSIRVLYEEWYNRILSEFETNPDDYYSYRNDSFLKELAVCSQKLIPVGGAWVVEVSGISRRFVLKISARQLFREAWFFICKLKGFKPFYQMHMVLKLAPGFNETERENAYHRIAELLKLNGEIKGMFASSWYYDPKIMRISPHLAYLRQTPERNGAKFYRIGSSKIDITNALQKSENRRRLYSDGKYLPTNYLEVWHRNDLILWSENLHLKSKTCLSKC